MESVENTATHIGYRRWRPRWMQRFATAKTFVLFMCLLTLVESMMLVGYTSSVLTSIERRFQIKSAEAGLIVSAYEVGNFLVVAFVSYLGGRPGSHRPKWVGFGAFIMSVAALIFTLPHLIGEAYIPGRVNSENETDVSICIRNTTSTTASRQAEQSDNPILDTDVRDVTVYYDCMEGGGNASDYLFFFVIAQLLLGMGAAPMFTLGVTYVDDNIGATESASYIGIVYCVTAIGPALGFLLGGLCVSYYVDVGSVSAEDVNISPGDPQWVGAWWIGYLICGFLITLFALPVLAYPRTLRRSRDYEDDDRPKSISEGGDQESRMVHMQFDCSSCREFLQALKRLFTNPTYMLVNVVASLELSIVTGFVYFMPKLLEIQYGTTSSKANIITGSIIPPAAAGIIIGGFIVRRYHFTLEKCTRFAFIVSSITLMFLLSLFLVKCDNQQFAGVSHSTNTSSCFVNCGCHDKDYQPVCGVDAVTYFSPCHAGCSNHRYDKELDKELFTQCTCITHNDDVTWDARDGKCDSTCDKLPIFMSLVIVIVFVTAISQIPLLMATLRSVYGRDRPFALGIQFVFLRVLAYIPAPIYFGKTIDSSCMLWQTLCEGVGSCFEYEKSQFQANYLGLSVGLKTISVVFALLCWLSCRYTCRCCSNRDFSRLSQEIKPPERKDDEELDDLEDLQEVPVQPEMVDSDSRPRLELLTVDANI
ncbi:solute carrier organic anion transporter family member 5A1-like isoform X2 [Anneissia japonica]|uniref:solute carrier organic anion transporter family member 5A1-like isoform X2 n=1 Tax=Anneissia japonica TaxID=1529436 RepID=UPI00142574CD|nr:solute carrier organic anion transporter family member 5A1-like isoform X2 [Anneissia japonica]